MWEVVVVLQARFIFAFWWSTPRSFIAGEEDLGRRLGFASLSLRLLTLAFQFMRRERLDQCSSGRLALLTAQLLYSRRESRAAVSFLAFLAPHVVASSELLRKSEPLPLSPLATFTLCSLPKGIYSRISSDRNALRRRPQRLRSSRCSRSSRRRRRTRSGRSPCRVLQT